MALAKMDSERVVKVHVKHTAASLLRGAEYIQILSMSNFSEISAYCRDMFLV